MFICSVMWWGAFFPRWWQSVVVMLVFFVGIAELLGVKKLELHCTLIPPSLSMALYSIIPFSLADLQKVCSVLQSSADSFRVNGCSLDIPNLEEQGEEMKDFEGKRSAAYKAAAGYQSGAEMVYVHCLLKWRTSYSLFKKKSRGVGGICVGRDQEGMVILPH